MARPPGSIRIALILALLGIGAVIGTALGIAAAQAQGERILYVRVATSLIPPSGPALRGGIDEVWVDWHAGTAFSRSIVPGELTAGERWYRRVNGHTQTWSLQVDGRALSDGGASPWADLVLSQSAGGLGGIRARYRRLLHGDSLRQGVQGDAPLIRINAAHDLLPDPLPGAMMQRGTVVWLDTRTGLPVIVARLLLPYIGGSNETEICRVVTLDEIPKRDAPHALAGPPAPSMWDRLLRVWRRATST